MSVGNEMFDSEFKKMFKALFLMLIPTHDGSKGPCRIEGP